MTKSITETNAKFIIKSMFFAKIWIFPEVPEKSAQDSIFSLYHNFWFWTRYSDWRYNCCTVQNQKLWYSILIKKINFSFTIYLPFVVCKACRNYVEIMEKTIQNHKWFLNGFWMVFLPLSKHFSKWFFDHYVKK